MTPPEPAPPQHKSRPFLLLFQCLLAVAALFVLHKFATRPPPLSPAEEAMMREHPSTK